MTLIHELNPNPPVMTLLIVDLSDSDRTRLAGRRPDGPRSAFQHLDLEKVRFIVTEISAHGLASRLDSTQPGAFDDRGGVRPRREVSEGSAESAAEA